MKILPLLLVFSLFLNSLHAQKEEKQKGIPELSALYLNGGGGKAFSGSVYGFGGSFILSNHWGGSLSLWIDEHQSNNSPLDYTRGVPFGSNCPPTDYIKCISAALLREFPTYGKLRFSVEAGPSYVTFKEVVFTPSQNQKWFSPNYDATYPATQRTIGLALRGRIDWPFSRFAGLEFAAISNINSLQSFLGFEAGLNLGFVRKRLVPGQRRPG